MDRTGFEPSSVTKPGSRRSKENFSSNKAAGYFQNNILKINVSNTNTITNSLLHNNKMLTILLECTKDRSKCKQL